MKYKSMSLMNTDAKNPQQKLANRIQQHIKRTIHLKSYQVGFTPGIQGWSNIQKTSQ